MRKSLLTAIAVAAFGLFAPESASAQNAILAEMYGRGVHAYYSGNNTDANQYLSMAINNGIEDPRAYYFRGMVAHASGRAYEAESDWQRGAELEASGKVAASIGRSLSRFQGSARIKLEQIRQTARLQALATSAARSQQRYGELGASAAPAAPAVVPSTPAPAISAPPAPAAEENPFADDSMGEANVVADDVLENAMEDPFPGAPDGGDAAPSTGDSSPFGDDAGTDANPFGDDAGSDASPFGDDAGMEGNPFD
ncbi:MAG: hypothetical protein AB8B91_15490 [Rubripirellula sp.]